MPRTPLCTIAISFSPNCPQPIKSKIIHRAANSVASFGSQKISYLNLNDEIAVLTNYPENNIATSQGTWLFMNSAAAVGSSGELLQPNMVVKKFIQNGEASFDDIEPPFLALAISRQGIIATTDSVGLGHLFVLQGDQYAAVATSASALGKTFERPFDHYGLFQQMTIGHRLQNITAFESVDMLPPGSSTLLKKGKHSLHKSPKETIAQTGSSVELGRRATTTAVERCLNAKPDCAIELSGGMDSRVALAAIPKQIRAGRKAYTIGYQGSPDLIIAQSIAKKNGLEHEFVDLAQFEDETNETIWKRARRVAYREDFATNIFDRLTIDCIDDVLLNQPRIGGVNGELARGFYYAGMPIRKNLTDNDISRLITWRLTTNDAAPRTLFIKDKLPGYNSALRESVSETLFQGPQPLGNALDNFYLQQRMRHWAGSNITRAANNRTMLNPFFHSEYISWAMSLPVEQKRDSIAFSRVLKALDPELSSLELDTTLVPDLVAKGGFVARTALLKIKAKKLSSKLRQRLLGQRRTNLGGSYFQTKLSRGEFLDRINWEQLGAIGLLDVAALNRLQSGEITGTRTTLGYLFALNFQIEYLNLKSQNFEVRDLESREIVREFSHKNS